LIDKIKDYFFRGQFFGEVDIINHRVVQGWIYDLKNPNKSILVEVVKDGKILSKTVADEFQPLLASSRLSNGNNGFVLKLNEDVCEKTLIIFKSEKKVLKKLLLKKLSLEKPKIDKSAIKIKKITNNLLLGEVRTDRGFIFTRPKLVIYVNGFFLGEKIAFLPFTLRDKNAFGLKKSRTTFSFAARIPATSMPNLVEAGKKITVEIFDNVGGKLLLKEKVLPTKDLLFDEDFYSATNEDLAHSSLETILHYHLFGKKESQKIKSNLPYNRHPHPLFDSYFYARKFLFPPSDLLSHYRERGSRKNITPHPLFDSKYYKKQAGDLEGLTALEHYVKKGIKNNLNPHPLFDIKFYRSQVWGQAYESNDLLAHYMTEGYLSSLNPHPDFDSHYCALVNKSPKHPVPLVSYLMAKPKLKKMNKTREYLNGLNIYPDKNDFTIITTSHEASLTGAPRIILELLRGFSKNYNVKCYSLITKPGPLMDEFRSVSKVIDLEHARASGVGNTGAIIKEIYNENSSFVIANSLETHKLMETFYALDIPFTALIHEFSELYPKQIVKRIVKHADALVFPAKLVEQSAARSSGEVFEEKSYVAPQGFSRSEFLLDNKEHNRALLRKELGLASDTKIVLGCGSVDIRKGVDLFIAIAKNVLSKEDSKIKFVWLGNNEEKDCPGGRFRFWLEQDLKRAGLNDKVFFVGSKKSVAKYFQAADVFLMTSRLDPFPYVALEAMHSALPLIMFSGGNGVVELVNENSAVVIPHLDISKASEKIIELTNNPILAKKIGSNAKDQIKQKLSHKDYLQTMIDISMKISNEQTRNSFIMANEKLFASNKNFTKKNSTKKNYSAVA